MHMRVNKWNRRQKTRPIIKGIWSPASSINSTFHIDERFIALVSQKKIKCFENSYACETPITSNFSAPSQCFSCFWVSTICIPSDEDIEIQRLEPHMPPESSWLSKCGLLTLHVSKICDLSSSHLSHHNKSLLVISAFGKWAACSILHIWNVAHRCPNSRN